MYFCKNKNQDSAPLNSFLDKFFYAVTPEQTGAVLFLAPEPWFIQYLIHTRMTAKRAPCCRLYIMRDLWMILLRNPICAIFVETPQFVTGVWPIVPTLMAVIRHVSSALSTAIIPITTHQPRPNPDAINNVLGVHNNDMQSYFFHQYSINATMLHCMIQPLHCMAFISPVLFLYLAI